MRRCSRISRFAVAALTVTAISGGGPVDPWGETLWQLPASAVDPALPTNKSFRLWLREILTDQPPGTTFTGLVLKRCSDGSGCSRNYVIDIPSRARALILTFDWGSHAFLGGKMFPTELEEAPPIASLAELPRWTSATMRPRKLDCPHGTTRRLEEEYAGRREWCEDLAGVKHGPARAWFNTGLYLMYRGAYRDGERHGVWFECDRFERCQERRDVKGEIMPVQGGG